MNHGRVLIWGLLIGLTNAGGSAPVIWAQGVLIITNHLGPLPRPIAPLQPVPHVPISAPVSAYKIKALRVQATIIEQVARVHVSQSFVNTGSQPLEVQFLFPLPEDGAIDSLMLLVDGQECLGKLVPAKEARSKYEAIVRSNKDPALLEWMGRGLFQTSVFPVPPGAERKVVLHYNQLLRKDHGLTDFVFPLSTARYTSHAIDKTEIQIMLESVSDIKNIYSPTHAVDIKRSDAQHAVITLSSTNDVPTSDFRLLFDVDQGQIGASVISYKPKDDEEGYFLLLASPRVQTHAADRLPKAVLFVIDRSGSMAGKKIEQAKSAVTFVINNLHDGDLFNIVAYDNNVESFLPALVKYDEQTRKAALGYVAGLSSRGGTDIHQSLTSALHQFTDNTRPNYVLFLTDGLPTTGVTDETQIAAGSTAANTFRARILTFGVGYDVNSRLLDRIARDGSGRSEYVPPGEDIETHVSAVYGNISAPVLTDVAVKFELDGINFAGEPAVNRIYPKANFDLFEGQQLVVVGRYKKPGAAKVVIQGRVASREQQFDFPANLIEKSHDERDAFVEKLWVMRRIGEIIDQLDLSGNNDELVTELVKLSTRYGILTPYTSFLADETLRPLANQDAIDRTQRNLPALSEHSGRSGVGQRAAKGEFQNAQTLPSPAKTFRDAKTGIVVTTDSVRQYGNQVVYARKILNTQPAETTTSPADDTAAQQIVVTPETAGLDLETDKDRIEVIERFTEPYFVLIHSNTFAENKILSQQRTDERLLISLRGKNYLVQ